MITLTYQQAAAAGLTIFIAGMIAWIVVIAIIGIKVEIEPHK